ncbi:MAG: V-type ATPase subunit [Nitrososphaeria archaeon]
MPGLTEYEDDVYAITKAYFVRGTLLDKTFFKLAVGFTSVEELAERLRATRYGVDIGSEKITGAKEFEKTLMGSLIGLHYRLMRIYSCEGVLDVMFNRYISWDVKAVLRGKAVGQQYERILEGLYMRAEESLGRRDLIVRAAAAKDLGGAVMGLSGTEYYDVAQEGLKIYESTGDPASFDIVIDRFTVENIADIAIKSGEDEDTYMGRLVLSMVDEYNLGLALRYQTIGLPASQAAQLLISRGNLYLSPDPLRRLISEAAQPPSYADLLRRTPYGEHLQGEAAEAVVGSVASFRLHLAEGAWAAAAMECPVLAALVFLVENEVRNLSAIAFGIENRVPKDEIYGLLRFPT